MLQMTLDEYMTAIKEQIEYVAEHYDALVASDGIDEAEKRLEIGVGVSRRMAQLAVEIEANVPLKDMLVNAVWDVAMLWMDIRQGLMTVEDIEKQANDAVTDENIIAWLSKHKGGKPN